MKSRWGLVCFLPALAWAQVDGGSDAGEEAPAMQIEGFEPLAVADAGLAVAPAVVVEAMPSAPSGPTVELAGDVEGTTSLDTRFESPKGADLAENVWEGRLLAHLSADVKINEHLRAYIEGRGWLRSAFQRDFDRAKAWFDPELREAYVDLYTSKVDLRVGNQRIALGANPLGAPADILNPRDFRFGLFAAPEDSAIPVFAVRAQGEVGKVQWLAAYVPFFVGHRFVLFGQDEALLQPALAPEAPYRRVDQSIEDSLQDKLLATKNPTPFLGDVAIRLRSSGKYKVGVSWVWANEKAPQVTVDGELGSLLAAQAAGKPTDPALFLSLQSRAAAGETLFTGRYLRQHVFSFEGSLLLGPVQLDADVSYSPRQTFVNEKGEPLNKQVVSGVLSVSRASEGDLFYAVTYLGMVVPDVLSAEQLILLEPATAVGASRTAFFHLFTGVVGYQLFDKKLELSMTAMFEPIQLSFALAPRVTWKPSEGWQLWLAAEFFEGPAYSALGYFGRNDKVTLGIRRELF